MFIIRLKLRTLSVSTLIFFYNIFIFMQVTNYDNNIINIITLKSSQYLTLTCKCHKKKVKNKDKMFLNVSLKMDQFIILHLKLIITKLTTQD